MSPLSLEGARRCERVRGSTVPSRAALMTGSVTTTAGTMRTTKRWTLRRKMGTWTLPEGATGKLVAAEER